MLTFDGVLHFGEVFSSWMNPGFHCTGQTADSMYGVVWVSGLLMSTLWIEWPMLVGLWYHDEILRPIVVPFIHDHHLMLQHDNPRPHVAKICTQFLEAKNIPVLALPAYSLDMSPIEHVWDALDRCIRQHVPVPANIQQLCTAIEEEWTNIPQATINNLINSMQRRCVALHEANGGLHPQYSKTANFRVVFYCGQLKAHLCNNHAV